MTSRKKPGVAFWATVVVVVLLIGYPLSIGPACWITSRLGFGDEFVSTAYQPILRAVKTAEGSPLDDALMWYAYLGAPEDWVWGSISVADDSGEQVDHWDWVQIIR
jgi:hypothetical protein